MSISDCIRDALEAGFVSESKANEATEAYDALVKAGMDPVAAAEKMKRAVKSSKQADRFAAIKRAKLAFKLEQKIMNLDRDGVYDFLPDYLEGIHTHAQHSYKNILLQKVAELIEESNPKYAGLVKPVEHLPGVVRALYEEGGTAAEKSMAEGIKEMNDMVVRLMRANGVHIEADPDFRLPQTHSKVAMANREQWVEDHLVDGVLDWDKMSKFNDDKPVLDTPEEKRRVLQNTWVTLNSNGANSLEKSGSSKGALATKYAHQRFLRYKTADSWLEMQGKYGEGDPFQAIVQYAEMAAQDIAMSEALGPAPRSMFDSMTAMVERRASQLLDEGVPPRGIFKEDALYAKNISTEVGKVAKLSREMFDMLTHANSAAEGALIARFGQVIRTGIVSAFLGSTGVLAAVTDNFGSTFARHMTGSRSGKYKTLYRNLMNPLNDMTRKEALRSGLGFDAAIKSAAGAERYFGEIIAPMWARRISDVSMRLNGLTPHTQSAQWAHGLEFMGTLADVSGKTLDEVRADKQYSKLGETMENYDITPRDWDDFRATSIFSGGLYEMLRPADLFNRADLSPERQIELFSKFSKMLYMEREFAIPTMTLRGETALRANVRAGTYVGESVLSGKMFKSFPVTLWMTHFRRAARMNWPDRAKYLGSYAVMMTLGGAIATQLIAITQGRTPEDMTDPDFWARASLKGGGLGFLGDLIFGNVNKYGGLQASAAGPVWQFLQDTNDLTVGSLMKKYNDDDPNFSAKLLRYVDRYAPAVDAAPISILTQRVIMDNLRKELDPKAYARFRAMEKRARERGSEYWWRPGQTLPEPLK